MPEPERSEHWLAIFVDFENLALGFQGRRDRFDITRVLKRMVEKGKIVAKKAYADWNRYSNFTNLLHESAIELIEIPHRNQSGKNSADIHLCVDAMDLAYSKDHIDTFVIVSGDSDFSPLVSKLKELGKHVIGLGMQGSTSELLRDNCDEFIYYEDLGDQQVGEWKEIDASLPEPKKKAFALLLDSCLALRRENKQDLWSSMIKDTMKRKKPSFNETYHGYSTFSHLLEDAQKHGLIDLQTNTKSGTYVVTRFGDEMKLERQPPRRREPTTDRPRGDSRPRGRTGNSRPRNDGERPALRRQPTELAGPPAREPAERPVRGYALDLLEEAEQAPVARYPARRPAPIEGEEPPLRRPRPAPAERGPAERVPAERAPAERGPAPRRPMPAEGEAPRERQPRRPRPEGDAPPERLPRRRPAPVEGAGELPAISRPAEEPVRSPRPEPARAPRETREEPRSVAEPPASPRGFGEGIFD